jgi:hypothetical protein
MPENPEHNFLTDTIKRTLSSKEVAFKFLVQPRTSDALSVEDTMTEWKPEDAPFHEVGILRIPQQEFDTAEMRRMGESISFNVWHSLPEHKPLGAVNRMRKVVYERISRVRNEMNSVKRQEPAG